MLSSQRDRFLGIAVICGLILLPLFFWWRLWTFDSADRGVISSGDFSSQYYPLQSFAARELAQGRWPAWDPYINAGQPGLADIQTGTFYPLNLIPNLVLALLDFPFNIDFLTAQVIIHFSLASLYIYLFVRRIIRRQGASVPTARFAGVIAALTFTYSGYLTSFPTQQLTILETSVWLPLILFFVDRAFCDSHSRSQLVLASMALACALLAGHPQTSLYVIYTTLAYGVFLGWSSRDRERISTYLQPGLILVLGVALAAVQLWPTVEFISRSTRVHWDYQAMVGGFSPAELIHLVYPKASGGSPLYLGVLSPIFALTALCWKPTRRQVLFWWAIGIGALLLALGQRTFLYDLVYLLIPGFAIVRNQERVIFLYCFAMSVLAGFGALPLMHWLRRHQLGLWRGLSWAGPVCLILLNLFTVNGENNLTEPPAGGPFPETGLVDFLRNQPGTFRVFSAGLLPGGAGAGTVYEIEDTMGATPLRLQRFQEFQDQVGAWRQWQLLNVHYALAWQDMDRPWLQRAYEEGGITVYRVGDALPRAWVVHDAVTAEDGLALATLNSIDFDPMRVALLEPSAKELALPGGPGSEAQVVEASPGKLVLGVSSRDDGLLIVGQPYYPGWRATVDGEPAAIHRVNYLLQGIPVGSDTRRVELTFHLSPWPAVISVTVWLGCLGRLAFRRRV